jgi:multiple sugar transport system ATP-binding protein
MSGLKIENLTKSFDGHIILDDINIEARAGELLVVLGPSGCGKSTLLRLISGLETPDRGRIILDDRDITGLEPQKRKTALVFQNYALYPHMTVFENMAFPLRVVHTSKNEMKRIIDETAHLLELDQLLDRRPAQLSGGQRQRVALGRGLVRQPSIFLLDEPLSNLDAALRLKMRQEIVALQKRLGITMIYVTHDQVEALTMADRMAVVRDGKIHQCGTPMEIYNDPHDRYVAGFIGTPPINLFADEIRDGRGQNLPIPYGDRIADGRYEIGIRPEYIRLDSEGAVMAEIVSAEYIGAAIHIKARAGSIVLTMTVGGQPDHYKIGQPVRLAVDVDRIFLFSPDSGERLHIG